MSAAADRRPRGNRGEAVGRTARTENFPVASRLLAASVRPHVLAFYSFVRTADDIADSPVLDAAAKLAGLDRLETALLDGCAEGAGLPPAAALRVSLAETGVPARHALDVLAAFRQDAVQSRYVDWADLIRYCDRSAAPVGRYLLDLHGEDPALYRLADPLCNALQILNHLQDCGDDYRRLDRIYLPQDWMAEAGCDPHALGGGAAPPALRRVLERTLDGAVGLLDDARGLAAEMRDRRLAMETRVIVAVARRLSARLRGADPLARRIRLTRGDRLACIIAGMAGWLAGR